MEHLEPRKFRLRRLVPSQPQRKEDTNEPRKFRLRRLVPSQPQRKEDTNEPRKFRLRRLVPSQPQRKEDTNEPRKFRLRGLVPFQPQRKEDTNESIISKSLEPLEQNVEKKERAQEIYYENHAEQLGVSPLLRDLGKQPVKQRLGRWVPFPGTNTSAIPPKQRLRRLNNTKNNQIHEGNPGVTSLNDASTSSEQYQTRRYF